MNLSPSQAFSVSVHLRGPRHGAEMTFCLGFVPYPYMLIHISPGSPSACRSEKQPAVVGRARWALPLFRHVRHPALLLVVEITAAQLTVCPLCARPGAVFAGGLVLLSFCYCPVRWAPSCRLEAAAQQED